MEPDPVLISSYKRINRAIYSSIRHAIQSEASGLDYHFEAYSKYYRSIPDVSGGGAEEGQPIATSQPSPQRTAVSRTHEIKPRF